MKYLTMRIPYCICLMLAALSLVCSCRNDHSGSTNNTGGTTKVYLDSVHKLAELSDSIRHADKQKARELAYRALVLARKIKSPEALAVAYQIMGVINVKDQADSAFFYYGRAVKIADSIYYPEVSMTSRYNLSLMYQYAYNLKPAVLLLDSMMYYAKRENNFERISDAYNALGAIQFALHDSVKAKEMFVKAVEIAKEHNLYRQQGLALANLAGYETNAHSVELANLQVLKLLQKGRGSVQEIAGIFVNLGGCQQTPDSSLFYLNQGLKLAQTDHLQEIECMAYNSMAYSYLDKGDVSSAEKCITEHALPLAKKIKNYDLLTAVYDTYADVLSAKSNFQAALENEKKALSSKNLEVSGKAMEQVRLLNGLLELKNMEATIASRENDILKQGNHIRTMRLWLLICILMIAGSLMFILWLRQHTRARIQMEQIGSAKKIIEIEELEKARLARELHDTTGQLVQGLSAHIEAIRLPGAELNREISVKLDELHQNIRRFSHRVGHVATEKFSLEQLITGLCEDVQSLTGIKLKYQVPEFTIAFPEDVVLHIYRIVQELLTNANKYAGETNVRIQLAMIENSLLLFYVDEGPGFNDSGQNQSTMGLVNIRTRVKLMGGTSVLKTSPGNGTSWDIRIPLDHIVEPKKKNI